jgi:hypothetical protein
MSGIGKRDESTKKAQDTKVADKAKKPPPPPSRVDDDDYEDGDIATPKPDRYGSDDEPL